MTLNDPIKIEPWNWQCPTTTNEQISQQELEDEIGEREYNVMLADQAREEREARDEESGINEEDSTDQEIATDEREFNE